MTVQTIIGFSLKRASFTSLAFWLLVTMMVVPLVAVLFGWSEIDREIWSHLMATELWELIANTLLLVLGVSIGVSVIGVSLAWFVATYHFPGRRFFNWALMLPLAIPGYVLAFVYYGIFDFSGPVQSLWRDVFGRSVAFPSSPTVINVSLVFSLVLYPYVYMIARSSFIRQGDKLLQASQTLGKSRLNAILTVALPAARPAIVGGMMLALMETLADFGTVATFNSPLPACNLATKAHPSKKQRHCCGQQCRASSQH